ncbi:MAG: pantoate--beta-alanine ligase, partial [Gemmatimonadales bacterium]|nr:pantoate--beta-alanine ligase [Gemmatimonadales bacterium]
VQQLTLIRRMVEDLDWPVEIVSVPTVRESDGLALSSRNAYLGADERGRAGVLSRALQAAHQAWRGGETSARGLEARIRQELAKEPSVTVEYISIADPDALAPVDSVDERTVVSLAARIGGTRLIDNIKLGEGIP